MNKWPAAAIGSAVTPLENRIYHNDDKSKRNEGCSTHPGHVSGVDDKTLFWLNSGFVRCKHYEAANEEALKSPLNPAGFESLFELK